jgi:xanthine/CO dehydrogenase XdhC/CoxF family maturation factor
MHEIATRLTRWLGDGERIALATVVWAEGSSPRPLGWRMAVAGSGQMAGSVSGECVEGAVFEEAQGVLSGGPPKRLRYGAVDETGWEVGLACGGTIEVHLERLAEIHRRLLEALEAEETIARWRPASTAGLTCWPGPTAGWAVPLLLAPAAPVYVPVVAIRRRTWSASRATRRSARSVAHRWSVNNELASGARVLHTGHRASCTTEEGLGCVQGVVRWEKT